jgi:hypothetical protein
MYIVYTCECNWTVSQILSLPRETEAIHVRCRAGLVHDSLSLKDLVAFEAIYSL